jgi:DNA-binding MarR family transcriptional regulator
MPATNGVRWIRTLLGSAHVLVTALDDLLQSRLRAEIPEPVTPSQLELLNLIARAAPVSVGRVASLLRVSNPAASKSVDRLVRRGLVRRGESAGDRRVVVLELTREGRVLLDEYDRAIQRTLEETFAGVELDGLGAAADLLDRLSIAAVERSPEPEAACFRCGIYLRETCSLRERWACVCDRCGVESSGGGARPSGDGRQDSPSRWRCRDEAEERGQDGP